MNAPIRRLSAVVAMLFAALLISTTVIQAVQARDLNARSDNRRTLLSSYAQERGQILVDNTAIAASTPSKDEFKWQREYPQGELYAHVTGYYSFTYGTGGGLENAENSLLSGQSDKLFIRRVSDIFKGKSSQGASLELTINPAAQKAAADALGTQRGAAVALDPRTGAILAMVSRPSYDPGVLSSHDLGAVNKAWKALTTDKARPMENRTIAGRLYPPGSVFKIVTAAAALSSGNYTMETVVPAPRVLDLPQTTADLPNYGGRACSSDNEMKLIDALRISCNTAFGALGMELGGDALRAQAARFGVGDSLSIPMRVTPSSVPSELNAPQTAQAAIGQYDVRVTPLQVAMISAAVANRGIVMRPYLVQRVLSNDLSVLDEARPEQLSEAITPDVASQLVTMMRKVVDDGSGRAARIPGVAVAGKTGTAQHARGAAPHAWFTAFAPADDPVIAVAVVVEDGGDMGSEAVGGAVAAPIAKKIIEAVLR